jgi:putative ABC transport system permease protein
VQRFPEDAQARALHERLSQELDALPGVESVGAATALPLTSSASQTTVVFPGAPGNKGDEDMDAPLVDYVMTRPGYFETLGIELLDGRFFGTAHAPGAREAVIDRTLAERFFPGGSAVGATLRFRGDTVTVVGVAEHARMDDVHRDGRPQLFLRNDDYTSHTLNFALRSGRSLPELVPEVRAAVGRVDAQLAVSDVETMDAVVDGALRQPRLSAVLLSAFSIGALMLAAMGLYGVVAGAVSRRRHEIAVRLALGADHRRVLRLVVGEGARLVVLGLLVAVPGIYVAGRLLGGMLVGISSFDVPTLLAVALGLGLVAAVACVVPARRVAGIEPAQSLREG